MEVLAKLFDAKKPPPRTTTINRICHILDTILQDYWFKLTRREKDKVVLYTVLLATSLYILGPSILPRSQDKMLSRQRADKYTTGLINMNIDCFANSTLQSLAALPGLNDYLNELSNAIYNNSEIRSSFNPPDMPLHEALIGLLANLQKIVYKSKTLSVWDFLSVLERIFKSKISKNQHDAHELLQLILETLFQENLKLYKYAIRSGMTKVVSVPPLPFKSLITNQLQCTVCGGASNVNHSPMMILTLPVPQEASIKLSQLIERNESEFIEGYSCLRCKINAIINLETQKRFLDDDTLTKLKKLQSDEALMINDDLSKEMQHIVDNYKSPNGFDISSVKTTIRKKNNIVKPPKILPVHLSRSIFFNTQESRNPCQVLFPDELVLETDNELVAQVEKIEDQKYLSEFDKQDLEPIKEEEFLKPSILKDDDDKQEDAFYEDVGQTSDIDEDNHSLDEDEEFADEDVIEEEEDHTAASNSASPIFKKQFEESPPTSATNSNGTNYKPNGSSFAGPAAQSPDPLTIEVPSTTATTKHKYVLKSMIRHVGTHQAGHYECYRHKPEFYKNENDEVQVNFPFLVSGIDVNDEEVKSHGGSESAISDSQTTDPDLHSSKISRSSSMNKSRSASISRPSRSGSVAPLSPPHLEAEPASPGLSRSSSKKRSRRFSRRLSSILGGGSNNIDDVTSAVDDLRLTAAKTRKRKKRLGSYVKYPFWRISDSKITESKIDDVLNDNKAVYMLFYERVD